MHELSHRMKQMEDAPLPPTLHGKIMRRIYFYRLRGPLAMIFMLLLVNVAVSGWHVWVGMTQLNTLTIITSILDGFEGSIDFLVNATQNISQIIPIMPLSMFTLNCILFGYVAFLLVKTRTLSPKVET